MSDDVKTPQTVEDRAELIDQVMSQLQEAFAFNQMYLIAVDQKGIVTETGLVSRAFKSVEAEAKRDALSVAVILSMEPGEDLDLNLPGVGLAAFHRSPLPHPMQDSRREGRGADLTGGEGEPQDSAHGDDQRGDDNEFPCSPV